MRAVFPEHFFRKDDAGSVDDATKRSQRRRGCKGALNARFISDVDALEASARAELGCEPFSGR